MAVLVRFPAHFLWYKDVLVSLITSTIYIHISLKLVNYVNSFVLAFKTTHQLLSSGYVSILYTLCTVTTFLIEMTLTIKENYYSLVCNKQSTNLSSYAAVIIKGKLTLNALLLISLLLKFLKKRL